MDPVNSRQRHVCIAGNIGAGKSSLTALYAAERGATPVYEAVGENPYLADFYRDMRTYGLRSQLFFLGRRLRQQQDVAALGGLVVQDRSLYEDAEVFARNLHRQGVIDDRDWATYLTLYEAAARSVRAPDLVVYLKASLPTLRQRIATRGRDYEKALPEAYLEGLNALYGEWASTYARGPLLVVDADRLDFVGRKADLATVLADIDRALGEGAP